MNDLDHPTHDMPTNAVHSDRSSILISGAVILLITLAGLWFVHEKLLAEMVASSHAERAEREAMRARLNNLEATVNSLANAGTGTSNPEDLSALTTGLAQLSERVTTLEAAPAAPAATAAPIAPAIATPAPLTPSTATASTTTAAPVTPPVSATPVVTPPREVSPSLATKNELVGKSEYDLLRRAVSKGTAYAPELALWAKLNPSFTREILALGAVADTGIRSDAAIIARLRELLNAAAAEAEKSSSNPTVDGINRHLSGLVKVRKVSETNPYAAVQRDLDHAELATVIRMVERLDAGARAPLESWLGEAIATRDAQGALAQLDAQYGVAP